MIRIIFSLFATVALLIAFPDATGYAETPKIGEQVEDFSLPVVGSEDEELSLREMYHEGPTVVVVLRGFPGYQCPLCSKQVNSLANRAETLGKLAHRVILVYPGPSNELEQHASDFIGPRTLPEPMVVVRDAEMRMVESWGLRWKAPRETAYPSTFVIDTDGTVVWSKVSDSHAGRAETEEIVKALRKINRN